MEILPGSTTDLGEREHNAPHFTLVAKTILADDFQLRVPGRGSVSCNDMSRDKLMLSGRGLPTDEQIRTLLQLSARWLEILDCSVLATYDDEEPCRFCCMISAP